MVLYVPAYYDRRQGVLAHMIVLCYTMVESVLFCFKFPSERCFLARIMGADGADGDFVDYL